ncbi:unnamed protein product [Rotaria socialis]|uniref:CTCK domain-containing protein n=1 Tax=Rotaria socialis TaxID=392032 RepID=A0A820W5I4_9BILA|nr:unnamed protein product [Rotaria socialis]CAF3355507.1 unnamed protein product [Rotaria socialis]CAF3456487.1 unnamed protein product [Rotaria socialis]CAF3526146.1 unnamed protein product [Rotaria socialis]CAF3531033.1 unnamed protein product [Rotaria socialis]
MVGIPIFLFLLIHINLSSTTTTLVKHHCQVEPYTETIYLQNCRSQPIKIDTTRCRGQCYSEDLLIYDWQNAPTHYRHKRHLFCCSPTNTEAQEIRVTCENENEPQTVKYRFVISCECKPCNDRCTE